MIHKGRVILNKCLNSLDRTDYILLILGLCIVAILYNAQDRGAIEPLEAVLITVIISFVTLLFILDRKIIIRMESTLTDVKEKLDLHCEFENIADSLETIIDVIKDNGDNSPKTEIATKRLNGLKHRLTHEILGKNTAIRALERLKGDDVSSFHAVSTFTPSVWLEPGLLEYFMRQMLVCHEKKM